MLVSIVATFYRQEKDIFDFLKSIAGLNFPKNQLEVIIVDNGSKSDLKDDIKKLLPNAQVLKNKTNRGAPAALNQGFKKAKGQYILKCDTDIILFTDTLSKLLEFLQKEPRVGIVGPRNYYKKPVGKTAPAAQRFNPWLGTFSAYGDLSKIQDPDYLQGCCVLFRKSLLLKTGYLDEGYGLWLFDDQDFCLKAKEAGFDVVYLPKAKILHSTQEISRSRPKVKLDQWYRNKIRFIIKNLTWPQVMTSLTIQMLSIPYYFLALNDGTDLSIVKGFWWNLKNFNVTYKLRK